MHWLNFTPLSTLVSRSPLWHESQSEGLPLYEKIERWIEGLPFHFGRLLGLALGSLPFIFWILKVIHDNILKWIAVRQDVLKISSHWASMWAPFQLYWSITSSKFDASSLQRVLQKILSECFQWLFPRCHHPLLEKLQPQLNCNFRVNVKGFRCWELCSYRLFNFRLNNGAFISARGRRHAATQSFGFERVLNWLVLRTL